MIMRYFFEVMTFHKTCPQIGFRYEIWQLQ